MASVIDHNAHVRLRAAYEFFGRVTHLNVPEIGNFQNYEFSRRGDPDDGGVAVAIDLAQVALNAMQVIVRLDERIPLGGFVRDARRLEL